MARNRIWDREASRHEFRADDRVSRRCPLDALVRDYRERNQAPDDRYLFQLPLERMV
jgi:hypothetical protein